MALSRVEINKRSDDKRGVKTKGIKLHLDTIALLKQLSTDLNMSESKIVTDAINSYAKKVK